MPQGTNLNISPYYDDFDKTKNYYKVLFKPGFPVQARELNTVQSIFQNQIESFGNYLFKEGSVVIPGGVSYQDYFYAVEIQSAFSGVEINNYLFGLEGKRIRGSSSNIVAKIVKVLPAAQSERNSNTLYVMYESSGGNESNIAQFFDSETLLMEEDLSYNGINISSGEGFAFTKALNANSIASGVTVNSGVYFVRGTLVDVPSQTILLDQYSNRPTYRVGFDIVEEIITAQQDESLYDNSIGTSNSSAPGADRLKISLVLTKKRISDYVNSDFIEVLRVRNGVIEVLNRDTQLNLIKNELAKRTFDESGDYIVSPYSVSVRESLNDFVSNNGVYDTPVVLETGNIASNDILLYQISPGKAYVKGFDVSSVTNKLIDIQKPRDVKEITNKVIPFTAGISVSVNNIYGSPQVGLGTTSVLSLRDSRVTSVGSSAAGSEIGLARIYDYSLSETYSNNSSQASIKLFDIQTYTTLTISSAITLSTPTLIVGKSSGARGYLKSNVSNSTTLTLYQVSGNFVRNEQFIVNGQENGRLITNVRDYNLSDIKSVYSSTGISTFNADLVLSSQTNLGPSGSIFTITPSSAGISTITSSGANFVGIVTVGNIVSYNNFSLGTSTLVNFNRVESVGAGGTFITVSSLPSVSGVCNGSLPGSTSNISNVSIVYPEFSNRNNSSLFTTLDNKNISSVNLSGSRLTVKYQFSNLTVTSSSVSVTISDDNLFFEPFSGTNYLLSYSDGTLETNLRSDSVVVTNNGKTLTINGLSKVSSVCNITCDLRRINITSKNKFLNRASTITVARSSEVSSGIGSTTLNDGLTYSNVYGTRVQDSEISLNVPDAVKVLAIYESTDTSEPALPTLTLNSFNGPNNSTIDFLIGEEIFGYNSKSLAVIVSKPSSTTIEVVYLTLNKFQPGEKLLSLETLVESDLISLTSGSKDITNNYILDNGQRDTIYDYSRIVRKPEFSAPSKKIKVIFQNYTIPTTDSGTFITSSSYSDVDYAKNVPTYSGNRNTDIIDVRPRVAQYDTSNTLSPFEFSSRIFNTPGTYSNNVISTNTTLVVNYSYYLPRIDKIYLDKDGYFSVSQGVPADNPEFPTQIDDALEIATIFLPAYLYDIKDAKVVLSKHKRYTMKDISKLEDRIERTEKLTSLSLLELDAKNFTIRDSVTGLDRFKSGIFVDNFKNHDNHDISDENFRASIDTTNSTLRPQNYSTIVELDVNNNSTGVRRTGDLVTLDYNVTEYQRQPFGTRVENVTPFLVSLWEGTVDTYPSSDNWVNERTSSSNTTIGNYDDIARRLGIDARTGLSAVDYVGNFQSALQGVDSSVVNNFGSEVVVSSETGGRVGTQYSVNEVTSSRVETREYTEVIRYIRERNIQFIGRNLKPYTQHYAFFDNVDVSQLIVPKLLEIEMVSGTFQVGETVRTRVSQIFSDTANSPFISFRVCTLNHKSGVYNDPNQTYPKNPYTQEILGSEYSSTSTLLNVDTESLQLRSESSYYGWVSVGMELIGTSSNAVARVTNIRLFTDNIGKVIGSLYIPDAVVGNLPRFQTGVKVLRLTSIRSNGLNILGTSESAGEGRFTASGTLRTRESITTTIRDARVTVRTLVPPAQPPEPVTPGGGGGEQIRCPLGTRWDGTRCVPFGAPSDGGPTPTPPTPTPPTPTPSTRRQDSIYFYFDRRNGNTVGVNLTGTTLNMPNEALRLGANLNIVEYDPNSATVVVSGSNRRVTTRVANRSEINALGGLTTLVQQRLITPEAASAVLNGYTQSLLDPSNRGLPTLRVGYEADTSLASLVAETARNSPGLQEVGGRRPAVVSYSPLTDTITETRSINISASGVVNRTQQAVFTKDGVFVGTTPRNPAAPAPARPIAMQTTSRVAPARGTTKSVCTRDPLAQSFFVPEPSGIFLNSVGVYFFSKDETLPVTLQIRTMESGLPSEEILPFSEVDLEPGQVLINETGLIETQFRFESPVYLPGGKEYAIVLLSNSTNYRVFIARFGEVDIATLNLPESQRVVVSQQPVLGSLFKSQNASTWTPSQYEDLKYAIYRCSFLRTPGVLNLNNPRFNVGNDRIPRIGSNAILTLSKKVSVGIRTTQYNSDVVPGVTIIQGNASGNLVSIGGSISNTSIVSAGIGYTPSSGSYTYNNISFVTNTGNGSGAVGIVTVTDGSVTGIVITTGGNNYAVGDILEVPSIGVGLGTGSRFTVVSIASSNTFNLDNVQGEFISGITTLSYINSSGVTTYVSVGATVSSVINDKLNDGLHIKVNHRNHSMHSRSNYVELYNVPPNSSFTTLSQNISSDFIGNVSVNNSTGFESFEGVGVGSTNPGYALIGNEIVSYTIVSPGVIGIQSRGIDGTQPIQYSSNETIKKYELNGVSLRRINKTHNFAIVDNFDVHPIDLDSYYLKIDMSTNGIDRSSGSTFNKLYFDETSVVSTISARASENVQFESITPTIRSLNFSDTRVNCRVRTITGTSISGNEESFIDSGFENITLNGINELNTPRLIASDVNERNFLTGLPSNKSLTLELTLSTINDFVSPVIDLEQTSLVLATNRLNKPVIDFKNDGRVNALSGDPHAAVYVSKKVTLKNPADSLKVILSAKLSSSNGIRVLYRLFRNDAPDTEQTWQLFPGSSNIDSRGNTINSEMSDGTSDSPVLPQSYGSFTEYEYTANNLPQFEGYQIKIDIFGENQADVPKLSDLRVIATA